MRKLLLGTLAVAVVALGCKGGNSVEGTWTVDSSSLPPGSKMEATFSSPDKLTINMDMPQDMGGTKANIHADITGTYKIEGEYMTIHADDVKFKVTGAPDNMKAMIDASAKQMGDTVKDQLNKEGKTKFAWVDKDHFTSTGKENKPETFTRVK